MTDFICLTTVSIGTIIGTVNNIVAGECALPGMRAPLCRRKVSGSERR